MTDTNEAQSLITACPACGSRDLKIAATMNVMVSVGFSGQDEHEVMNTEDGDILWEDDSYTECTDCGRAGELKDFVVPLSETGDEDE